MQSLPNGQYQDNNVVGTLAGGGGYQQRSGGLVSHNDEYEESRNRQNLFGDLDVLEMAEGLKPRQMRTMVIHGECDLFSKGGHQLPDMSIRIEEEEDAGQDGSTPMRINSQEFVTTPGISKKSFRRNKK